MSAVLGESSMVFTFLFVCFCLLKYSLIMHAISKDLAELQTEMNADTVLSM